MDQNVLPPRWKLKPIGKLGKIYSGSTPSTNNKAYWDGDINWITPNDLSDLQTRFIHSSERRITKAGLKNSATHVLPANSLVISSRAPIGYLALPTEEFCTNQGCKSIVFNEEHNPEFHYYNILFRVKLLKDKGHGTTFAEISKKALAQIEMPVPDDKKVQSKIAEVLSTIDRAIAQTEALIAKHQRIKTGLMQDLLTRGIDEHGQLRDLSTHKFKSTPLGMIPVEWEAAQIETKLLDIIDYRGKTPRKTDSGTWLITARNVRDGYLSPEPKEFIATETYDDWMTRGIPSPGDVLFTTEAPMGNVARIPYGKVAVGQRILTLVANPKVLDSDFLFWLLQWETTKERLKLMTTGSTVTGIKQAVFRKVIMQFPKTDEQKLIANILNAANEKIEKIQMQLSKLHHLKTGLMQDLLSGEVSVTPLLD